MRALGGPPEQMDQSEREVRGYAHDVLFPHHNKDYRSLCAFPLPALAGLVFNFIRVDSLGRANLESVTGSAAGPDAPQAWFLIHRRHMRLIHDEGRLDRQAFTSELALHASTGSRPKRGGHGLRIPRVDGFGVAAWCVDGTCPHALGHRR